MSAASTTGGANLAPSSQLPQADSAQKAPSERDVMQVLATTKRRRWRAWGWWLGAMFIVALAGLGWWLLRERRQAASEPEYLSMPTRRGDLRGSVTATGSLEALGQVDVGAEISGRIAVVHVDFNDAVKKGQVLCEIDPEQWAATRKQARAQLRAAQADLASRRANRTQAKSTVERSRSLSERGLVSKQALETAEATAAQAEAAVGAAAAQLELSRAALESAEITLSKTKIRSPIDGMVLARNVEPGQTVAATLQAPVLFTLARDLTQMELHIDIDEADVGQVAEGQTASFTVDTYPDRTFPAELTAIHNISTLRENVVVYEALLRVDNADLALRPGMTATVTIVTAKRDQALLVPNAALRFTPPSEIDRSGHGGPMGRMFRPRGERKAEEEPADVPARVWIMRGGHPVPVMLKTGLSDGEWTEVLDSELEADTEVLTDVITHEG